LTEHAPGRTLPKPNVKGGQATEALGFLAPFLSASYIILWALEPSLFGSASDIFPPLRWALATMMSCTLVLVLPRALSRGWPVVLFVTTLAITMLLDSGTAASFPIFARIASAAILALFAGSLKLKRRVTIARGVIICSAAIVFGSMVLGAAAPSVGYKLIGTERLRLYGLTPHPGTLGYLAALVATTLLSSGLFLNRGRSLNRRIRDLCFGTLATYALFLADSRTGQIATALGLMTAFGISVLISSRLIQKTIVVPWMAFSLLVFAAVLTPILVTSGSMQVTATAQDRYAESTAGRVEIWQGGLNDFSKNPLSGAGLASTYRPSNMAADAEPLFYFHSVLINYLAKGGIIVGIPLIFLLFLPPWAILIAARRIGRDPETIRSDRTLLFFCNAACMVTLVYAITEAALQNIYPSFLIFFFSALLISRGTR